MPQPTLIDRLLAEYAQTGRLPALSGGDGTDDPPTPPNPDPPADPKPQPVTFTPEQQAEINRIVAREAKAARDKAQQAERDRIKAEQDAAETERQRKADEEKGEFAKVRQSLEGERDQFKTEAERIKGEYEAIEGLFVKQYEAALKDLPEVVKAFAPADDAAITAKVDWLAKATEQAKKLDQNSPGNRPNPKPGGSGIDKEAAERARLATRPNF